MKNLKSSIILLLTSVLFLSCKDSKEAEAEKSISSFSNYVDSIAGVSKENLNKNWDKIESSYTEKKLQAQSSVETIADNPELKNKVDQINYKFEEFRSKILMEIEKLEATQQKTKLRSSLFDGKEINNDMNFDWINKDNILSVYETFVNAVSKNKDAYSREDWDEIKMLYEALDTRKNTVEKEGLNSSDNMKIAKEKVRFSSIYSLNRIGAKSEENANAKES